MFKTFFNICILNYQKIQIKSQTQIYDQINSIWAKTVQKNVLANKFGISIKICVFDAPQFNFVENFFGVIVAFLPIFKEMLKTKNIFKHFAKI